MLIRPHNLQRVGVFVFLFSYALTHVLGQGQAQAAESPKPEHVHSEFKAKDCPVCKNTGSVKCKRCGGTGQVKNAETPCSLCKGAKTIECQTCDDEGKIDCKVCKLRKVDGKKIYARVNPKYKKWRRKYRKYLNGFTGEKELKSQNIPLPPVKYIPCDVCGATGRVIDPRCKGTKKITCYRCKGTGIELARGTCPVCKGAKRVPCPKCGVLEGFEDTPAYASLKELLDNKFITQKEYFVRRRNLIARQKQLQKKLGAAASLASTLNTEVIVNRVFSEAAITKAGVEVTNLDKRKKNLTLLITGYAGGALPAKQYTELVKELALPRELVEEVERKAGAKSPRLKALSVLKTRFQAGELDITEYTKALDSL